MTAKRRHARPVLFGRAAIAAYLVCSYGLPRLEVVTPDVVLLGVAIWLCYELLQHGAERWLVVGVLLGVGCFGPQLPARRSCRFGSCR